MFRLLALLLAVGALEAQTYSTNLPATHYLEGKVADPVARLPKEKLTLDLAKLLANLGIATDSQALVFSKTSFQSAKISPRNPRAIYFNDEVAVGWVRGGDGLELAATDPRRGTIFYTLKPSESGGPVLARQEVCLKCHHGAATLGVPGIFIGSVYPNASGYPARDGAIITDQRTKFADRWGGWYVNAAHGEQPDRANAVASDPAEPHTLRPFLKPYLGDGYLTPVSDIVALMTFEHQTLMTDFLTRLAWDARMNVPAGDREADIQAAVSYMLFADEAPLKEPIEGVSSFTRTFPQRGPRDHLGRSLRDFDLRTRLFRYPLSYLIYSPQFDALPAGVRARIHELLRERLSGAGGREILEILQETKPDW